MQKISVIVICFNAEKTLGAALNSVCSQTYRNLEILVVDDGSVDRSVEIAEAFAEKDKRIRIIRHHKNRGILAARKTGVEQAVGDWIMHMDSDDLLLPHACETALKAIMQQKADFVQFGTMVSACENISEKEIIRKTQTLNNRAMQMDIRESNHKYDILHACFEEHRFSYTQWNKIYSASLLKKAYAQIEAEQINMSEDMYALFVITSMSQKMAVIEDRLYVYRFGNGISCANKNAPVQAFQNSCMTMRGVESVQKYVTGHHEKEKLQVYARSLRREMLQRTLSRFYPAVPKEYRPQAIKSLVSKWTLPELLHCLLTA